MCGIAGVVLANARVGADAAAAALAAGMGDALCHRGPDQGGTYTHADGRLFVALAARRLAILDLGPAGDQPMRTPDEEVCIAYNGELYNEPALRRELEARGYRYRSTSDTETVLYAYQEYGERALDRLNGMFAVAIYDRRRRRVVLARDRMGIKPLYYRFHGGRLVFASELRALLRDPEIPSEVDPTALDLYLALGYVPSPRALVRGVEKVAPGSALVLDESGAVVTRAFWQPALPQAQRLGARGARGAVRRVVADAVARQMRSDVPVGVLLSGGVDSSIVAACAARVAGEPLQTFSIRFDQGASPVPDLYNRDADVARRVAASIGAVHREVTCRDEEVPAHLDDLVGALDEPVWELSFISIFLMSRLAREAGVKVVLTGDGSDELFAGYPWIAAAARQALYERVPFLGAALALATRAIPAGTVLGQHARNLKAMVGSSVAARYERTHAIFDRDERAALRGAPPAPRGAGPLDALLEPLAAGVRHRTPADGLAFLDLLLWVREHFNQRLDRMSMLCSVEARVPFQDNDVVDLALSLPFGTKAPLGRPKGLLKRAFRGTVPEYVLRRPKRPFAAPMWAWSVGSLRALAHDTLDADRVKAAGVLQPDAARRALAATESPRQDQRTFQLWTLLVLQLWAEKTLAPRRRGAHTAAHR